jgi:hypothetical protein
MGSEIIIAFLALMREIKQEMMIVINHQGAFYKVSDNL